MFACYCTTPPLLGWVLQRQGPINRSANLFKTASNLFALVYGGESGGPDNFNQSTGHDVSASMRAPLLAHCLRYGMDAAKIKIMMEHCCLPDVGKVAILGHQFAFARPPAWFRKDLSGQRYKSEPPEMFGPPEW